MRIDIYGRVVTDLRVTSLRSGFQLTEEGSEKLVGPGGTLGRQPRPATS